MSWEEAKEEVVPEDREGSEPRRADTECRCHSDLEREAALTWEEWRMVAVAGKALSSAQSLRGQSKCSC